MRIIQHKKPILKNVHMRVDDVIDKKLLEFPAVKQCFSTSSTNFIVGGPGSGKTTFMIQMLKTIFKKIFHDIFIVMPENSLNSVSEKDNVFLKYVPPENIYHSYDVETLEEIYGKVEENANDDYYSLLIIDDYGNLLKQKEEAKILQAMFLKNRHLRLTAFVLCQNFTQMPKIVREIVNNVVLFNTNKSQNLKFFMEMFNENKNDFDALMKLLGTHHDYILCSLKYKKIFHNWNEILFD